MNDIPPLAGEAPGRDLPPGRHRQLREHLVREIRSREPGRAAGRPRRRAWLRPAVAGPAAAGVLTLAVFAGAALAGDVLGDGADGARTGAHPPGTASPGTQAGVLLERVAAAAARADAVPTARVDQYVYVKSKVAYSETSEDLDDPISGRGDRTMRIEPVHVREEWVPADGRREGLVREPGGFGDEDEVGLHNSGGSPFGAVPPGYDLETAPTDPDAMLAWLRGQDDPDDEARRSDREVFAAVGEMISMSLLPPETGAALYGAMARLPGVYAVPEAVDAAGRRGVAVARDDVYQPGSRTEWIFDERTLAFLGEREVATRDLTKDVEKGRVIGTSAILERGVVDELGRRP